MAESYNLCLDIGGTKVLGVIFNSKKEIVYRLKKRLSPAVILQRTSNSSSSVSLKS